MNIRISTRLIIFLAIFPSTLVGSKAQAPKPVEPTYHLKSNKYPVIQGQQSDNFFQLVVPANIHTAFGTTEAKNCNVIAHFNDSCVFRAFKDLSGNVISISGDNGNSWQDIDITRAYFNHVKNDEDKDLKNSDLYVLNKLIPSIPKDDSVVVLPAGFPDNSSYKSGYCGGIVLFHGEIRLYTTPKGVIGQKIINHNYVGEMDQRHPVFTDAALCYGPVSHTPINFEVNSGDMRRLTEALLIVSGRKPEEVPTPPPTKTETKAPSPAGEKAN